MTLADYTRAADREGAVEARLRECLPPWAAGTERLRRLERDLPHGKLAVCLDGIRAGVAGPSGHFLVECPGEGIELGALEGQPGGHRVAAELADQLRMAGGDRVQHVANVNSRDRARGAAQQRLSREREGDHRAANPILHPACDQADHALMPALVIQAHAAALERMRARVAQPAHRGQRFNLHACLDSATLLVELVEARSQQARRLVALGEQALDADGHVVDASGGIEPGSDAKGEIGRGEMLMAPCRELEQRTDSRHTAARADTSQTLRHEYAIVRIERDDI